MLRVAVAGTGTVGSWVLRAIARHRLDVRVVNSVVLDVEPLGQISISGPGAGPELAGQGVFSDLVGLSRTVPRRA